MNLADQEKGWTKAFRTNSLLAIVPIAGFSFWFLVAFPFADRNESYIWITYLERHSFLEIIADPIPSIRTLRPLAQALTWCLYHLSGGNGILIQIINFALLCIATWIMIPLAHESRKYDAGVLYLLIGFIYLPAFYYIFNLHGIFYSVILLVLAVMLRSQERVVANWKIWLFVWFILAFFHPLILVFGVAYLMGWILEKQQLNDNKIALSVIVLALVIITTKILFPFPIFSVISFQNMMGTMRNVETYIIVQIFTLLLCLLTLANRTRPEQMLLLTMMILYVPLVIIYDAPVLLLLGLMIELCLVIEKKWSLAAVLGVAVFFSLAVGSGAPTKSCIFLFLLPPLLLRTTSAFAIRDVRIPLVICVAVLTGMIASAVLIRIEIKVPLLSPLIRPLLVEKGKTYQLKNALALAQLQVPPRRIQFLQEKPDNIRDRGQPKNRDNFPPAKQKEFDSYQNYLLGSNTRAPIPIWYIAFGTGILRDSLFVVHTLQEKNCKPAYIYEVAHVMPVKKKD